MDTITKERPSLSIHVKRTHKRPGSIVSGTVIPHMSRDTTLHVGKFTIHLVGRIKVIRGKDSPGSDDEAGSHNETIFLDLETPLDEHPVKLQNWRVSPFFFTMPLDPKIENDRLRHWITKDRRPKPMTLPPSGNLGNGIAVNYSLELTIKDDDDGGCGGDISATLPLTFSNVRASDAENADELPTSISRQQALKLSSTDQRSLNLAVEFPRSIVQGETFPLTLRVLHTASHMVATKGFTTVPLISCRLILLEHTSISMNIATPSPSETTFASKHHELASWHASSTFAMKNESLPLITDTEEGLDVADLLGRPVIPDAFIPTFNCKGIQRSYGLKVLVRVEYDDGRVSSEMEFCVDDSRLWPCETDAMAESVELEEEREDADLFVSCGR